MTGQLKKIFLDSSVLFAGSYSTEGASAAIMDAVLEGRLDGVVSELVVEETLGALEERATASALLRFRAFLKAPALAVGGIPPLGSLERFLDLLPVKDCHVLASAVDAQSQYLLTLDRKHFFTESLMKADLPLVIATPGQFLEIWRESLEPKQPAEGPDESLPADLL